jgi:hypothetical protein
MSFSLLFGLNALVNIVATFAFMLPMMLFCIIGPAPLVSVLGQHRLC